MFGLVTFTVVPWERTLVLKLTQAYGSVDVRRERDEYSLRGVFIGNECALESYLGTAPGAGSL